MEQFIDTSILDTTLLEGNVSISTVSATCNIGTDIDIKNISKYMRLSLNDIITIKYYKYIRSLDNKVLKKKHKKKNNNFFNQLTVEVKISDNRKVNIKLFKNGSLHMSGCKNITDCNLALSKLIKRLKVIQAVVKDEKLHDIKYIEDAEKINVSNFKIIMINSNYRVNYKINRERLYALLKDKNINCKYEPAKHACVNIKFIDPSTKNVSIFVFESGSIIITGANNIDHINNAYRYITDILTNNYENIIKEDIDNIVDLLNEDEELQQEL
jgi:TATA-box binding protein (TBP) (component of TFIID and TFIIIB)